MKPETIMLVDDDEVFSFIFEEIVHDAGLEASVFTFKTGAEAIEYLRRVRVDPDTSKIPDLIFLDINMPAMNGWDFLDEYKKLNIEQIKHSFFVMLSSSVFDSDKQHAALYKEVVDFVVKPITPADLQRICEENLV